jgi:hypothetical protein
MKTKNALLTAVLTIAFTLPMFGQNTHSDEKMPEMKKHEMGKPTVDVTVDGLQMKIWLMTQKHHKKMMKEMKEEMKEMKHEAMEKKDTSMAMSEDMKEKKHDMDKATKEAMMAGTHHIMLVVTDAASGKEITNASAKVLIVSPSKKNLSVDLIPMMNHFGDGLALDEEGDYQFTVSVIFDGVSKTTQFQYEVED